MQHVKGGTYFADFELWTKFHLMKIGIYFLLDASLACKDVFKVNGDVTYP